MKNLLPLCWPSWPGAVISMIYVGAGGGGRTHMPSEGRGILSPVRLPVPPLQRRASMIATAQRRARSSVVS